MDMVERVALAIDRALEESAGMAVASVSPSPFHDDSVAELWDELIDRALTSSSPAGA